MLLQTLLVFPWEHVENISKLEDKLFQSLLEQRRRKAEGTIRVGWDSSQKNMVPNFTHEDKLFEELERRRKEVGYVSLPTLKKKVTFESPRLFKPCLSIDDNIVSDDLSTTSTAETVKVRNTRKVEMSDSNSSSPAIPQRCDALNNVMPTSQKETQNIIRSFSTMMETTKTGIENDYFFYMPTAEIEKGDTHRRVIECAICMCCGDLTSCHSIEDSSSFVTCADCRFFTPLDYFDEESAQQYPQNRHSFPTGHILGHHRKASSI